MHALWSGQPRDRHKSGEGQGRQCWWGARAAMRSSQNKYRTRPLPQRYSQDGQGDRVATKCLQTIESKGEAVGLGRVGGGRRGGGEKRASYAAASKSIQPEGQDGATGTNVKTSEDSRGAFVCGSVFRGARVARHARKTPREVAAFKRRVACVCREAQLSFNGEGSVSVGTGAGGTLSGKACCVQVEQGWAL